MNQKLQHPVGMRKALLRGTTALALLCLASPAFAYLDPSTGSMVVSAIVGIFASIALAVKTSWYRLKNLFKGQSRIVDKENRDSTQDTSRDG